MDPNVSALERAFQLAATGRYLTVTEIKLHLHKEGYNYEQIEGPVLRDQLKEIMAKAYAAHHARPAPERGKRGRPPHA
jgi:hypothetical protein